MAAQVARRMFTTEEFHRMAQAGILAEHDRVELIEGEIIRMSPIGSRHAACVDRLTGLFARRFGRRAIVRVQSPIVLSRRSEPQPDVAVLKPRPDFYAEKHPGPGDVLLVVEVVETSGDYDRTTKLPLYARAGIREVWLIDLPRNTVATYRQPTLRSYRDTDHVARGERLSPAAFPRTSFRVSEILG
jgi:Uma2 family endonuclease